MALELYSDKDYFFHTPRLKQSIIEEEIYIDAPPQTFEEETMPVLLTLGSMVTMLSSAVMNAYNAIAPKYKDYSELFQKLLTFILQNYYFAQLKVE